MKQAILIIALAIVASVAYGVIHDQITARICVEYFTIGHIPILGGTKDPTLLGFAWGFLATWWVGAMLGIPLAFVCQTGSLVKKSARDLVVPLLVLMIASGCLATVAGIVGYNLASGGHVWLRGTMADKVPQEKQVAFLTDLWIHSASYAGAF
ncbi:hypothetical protein [Blastopirellula marina]|uniref:Uncharacterized protein n=1 Tax=Blastopirellula marina TaxID=124 RepID=A0A2S8F4K3_9BACT|nr:hypothetical protein [Blastopirellula marina]PQO27070.1 hypothetical protein C5Y98_27850 [Blastopirellula marina]PTL41217.1 hypothetical protein C5Y97_27865 [Blastopirellula marina]